MAGSSSGDGDSRNENFSASQIFAPKTKKPQDKEGYPSSSTLPQVSDPKLAVSINNIPRSVSRSLWENSLYGNFFGRTPLALVQSVLPKIWKTNCSIQVIDMASGFFCFKFANKDDLNKVLARAFENIPRLCYTRGKVGHTSDQCSPKPETMEVQNSRAQQVEQLEYDVSLGIPARIESESLFGPWMIVNKKKKQSVRKKLETEVKTSNGFGSLADLNDELGNSAEKSNNLLHVNNDSSQKAIAPSMDFKMVTSSNSSNPFGSKKDKKGKFSVMEGKSMMKIEEFSSCSLKTIPIHINLEKNAEALHKKLTVTFAITVSNIKVVEDLQQEMEDPNLLLNTQSRDSKVRKPITQNIHMDSFPFNLKQRRAKKRKNFNDPNVIITNGDLGLKGNNKSTIMSLE
ncbi:hypothetical protein Cni_G22127 [Canna indica]|uniref:DUF4283 domain-containing protein n=1 Tax=Canna indica TaxID=4628 RepID=A0AAQ3KTS1_9LILI|nr:hypothetical protein Cni_G22127 [Canna indica]